VAISLGDAVLYLKTNSAALGRGLQQAESSVKGFVGRAADSLRKGLGKALETAGGFLLANVVMSGLRGIGNGIRSLTGGMVGLNSQFEDARAKIMAFTKDAGQAEAILAAVRKEADKTPFAFQEMANAAAGLIPVAKQAGKPLMELVKTAEILAASNPAQGLEGAAFALREAASGDFTSVIERFNLSRVTINRLKAEGVPALEAVTRAMQEMGYDSELVSNLANTLTGRWSTLTDTLDGVRKRLGAPLFEVLKTGLVEVQTFFDNNQESINRWANTIGTAIGRAAQWVWTQLKQFATNLAQTVQTWVNRLGSMESETARSIGRIAGFMAGLARQAVSWGTNIVNALSIGISAGVGLVTQALHFLGRVIGGLLKPGSPPKLLPQLTVWGQGAAEAWLDGWADADFDAFERLGGSIESYLRGLASAGMIDEQTLVPSILSTRDAIGDAITELSQTGTVGEAAFAKIREAAGSAGGKVEELARRQLALLGITRQLDAVNRRLQGIEAKQQDSTDNQRIAQLNAIMADPRVSQAQKERAQREREQLELMAEQRRLEQEQTDAEAGLSQQEKRLGIETQTLNLYAEQKQLLQSMLNAVNGIGKAIGDTLDPLQKQLAGIRLQQDELGALVRIAQLQAVLEDDKATAAEKAAAKLELQAIAVERAQRAAEALELGIDLSALSNIPITLGDIGAGLDGVTGGVNGEGGLLAAFEEAQAAVEGVAGVDFTALNDAIADAQKGFDEGQKAWDEFYKDLDENLAGLMEDINTIITDVKGLADEMGLTDLAEDIGSLISDARELAQQLGLIPPDNTQAASQWSQNIIGAIGAVREEAAKDTEAGSGGGFFSYLFRNAPAQIKGFKQLLAGDFYGFGSTLRDVFDSEMAILTGGVVGDLARFGANVGNWLKTTFTGLGSRVVDGIKGGITGAWNYALGEWRQNLQNWEDVFKGFFRIKSPSGLMYDHGVNIVQGLIDGVLGMGAALLDSLIGEKGILTRLGKTLSDTWADIKAKAAAAWGGEEGGIAWAIGQAFEAVKEKIKAPLNTVIGWINKVIRGFNDIAGKLPGGGIQLPEIGELATGTRDWRGGLAIVGERGPELVNLPQHARVWPNAQTQAMLAGAGGPSIVVQVEALYVRDDDDIYRIARRVVEEIKRRSR
jgi:hypothetical protein